MFETGEPYTGKALIAALDHLQRETDEYSVALPPGTFFAPQGQAWAPAAHVRHLSWAVRLVGLGVRVPRIFLRVAFGRGEGRSRDFAAVQTAYAAVLARGAQAPFTPSSKSPSTVPEVGRAQLVADLGRAVEYLIEGLSRWDEAE